MSWSEKYPKVYAAAKTAAVAFVAVFVPSVLGWLGDVVDWSQSDGAAFPSVDALGKAFVAAFVAAVAGLLSLALNWSQEHGFPGRPARYPTENGTTIALEPVLPPEE